jgi:hypothetical protein
MRCELRRKWNFSLKCTYAAVMSLMEYVKQLSSAILIVLTMLSASCLSAAEQCSVSQQQFRFVITGEFRLGERSARVTIPSALSEATVFVEAPAIPAAGDLFIETGGERVPFENAAALHVARRRESRLTLSIVTASGERLCSWEPPVAAPYRYPYATGASYRELDAVSRRTFQRMGEPIVWVIPGISIRETDEFRIDGKPAPVLAIAPDEVWLRDPDPKPGFRKLEGAGYETTYRISDVQMRVRDPAASRSVLDISINGVVNVQHDLLLWLGNPNREQIQLHCGSEPNVYREWDHRLDREAMKWIWLKPGDVRNGALKLSCPITQAPGSEPAIYVELIEVPRQRLRLF